MVKVSQRRRSRTAPEPHAPEAPNAPSDTTSPGAPVAPSDPMDPSDYYNSISSLVDAGDEEHLKAYLMDILGRYETKLRSDANRDYCVVYLVDTVRSISSFEAERIYAELAYSNPGRNRDVLLVISSSGGSVEPAYQIAKVCKAFAHERFTVAIPRRAKSAATLIALGADEIHIGMLGELGPIDPQLRGIPALAVSQALDKIASIVENHPGSSSLFGAFLASKLDVEQIGYVDRISESAAQYAERLLSTKPRLQTDAAEIAKRLVYDYKDHSFVIDYDEAFVVLERPSGTEASWIINDSPELRVVEKAYSVIDFADLLLRLRKERRLTVIGGRDDIWFFDQ